MYQKRILEPRAEKGWGNKNIKQRSMDKRGAIQFKNLFVEIDS